MKSVKWFWVNALLITVTVLIWISVTLSVAGFIYAVVTSDDPKDKEACVYDEELEAWYDGYGRFCDGG